jgi:parvulin-like peptidyl-prolyl isomerase
MVRFMGKDHLQKSPPSRPTGPHGATLKLKVRHILVQTFKQAEQISKELQKGANFEDLARKYSTDPVCKAQGGLLSNIEKNDVSEEFWDAASSLRINGVSDPVKDKKGFHIIMRII